MQLGHLYRLQRRGNSGDKEKARTVAHSSRFSTITCSGYMDGYWKNTTTTTTSYTIPAYTTYTYKSCGACGGGGKSTLQTTMPE